LGEGLAIPGLEPLVKPVTDPGEESR